MKRKRGVLSVWATLLIVLGVFAGVIGIVALVMFLTGQLDKNIVEPQDLSISIVDEKTLNPASPENVGYAQDNNFYVSNDFHLVVNTTTEDVTEKKVRLRFDGDYITNSPKRGYITDIENVLTVPEYVEIGTPFEVTLGREYNSDLDAEVVIGGLKTLTASSVANVELGYLTFSVAVDVPVSGIEIGVEQGKSTVFTETQTVTIGAKFDFRVNFKPEKSQKVFADASQQKEYFYDFSATNIRRNWKDKQFEAVARNGGTDTVTIYTFANSYYRYLALKKIEEDYSDTPNLKDTNPELYNTTILNLFAANPSWAVSKMVRIQVVDVTVNESSLKLRNGDSNVSVPLKSVYVDKYFTLTANSNNADDTLGATIHDTSGEEKPYLVANIGIKMPTIDNFVIEGGKVIQVTKENSSIEELEFNLQDAKAGKYKSNDTYSYYILPITSARNSGDYYWRFNATETKEETRVQTLAVNFFYTNEQDEYVALYDFDAKNEIEERKEKSITFTIVEQDVETPPYWNDSNDITMNITYDDEGNAKTAVVDLYEYLHQFDEPHIYDVVRFFLVFPNLDPTTNEQNIRDTFPYKAMGRYKTNYKDAPLKIAGYTQPVDGYALFELDGSLLYAMKSFSSQALVVAATIRTDADHMPYLDENGAYQIVNISNNAKAIKVDSALSIVNMEPYFYFNPEQIEPKDDGKYYIPAISRDASGSSLNMINFKLVIKNVDDSATEEKVIQAFQNKNLTIECLDAQGTLCDIQYLQLETLTPSQNAGTTFEFTGRIVINEEAFTAEHLDNYTAMDRGRELRLRIMYNNGIEKQYKDMTLDGGASTSSFVVYYPQPLGTSDENGNYYIEGAYEEYAASGIDPTEPIIVNLSNNTFTWNGVNLMDLKEGDEDAYDILNRLLSFTIKDQYGRPIPDGLYNIRLIEEDEKGNPVTAGAIGRSQMLDKIVNISPTADGEKTYLRAYIVEKAKDDYFVQVFEEKTFIPRNERLGSIKFTFDITGEGIHHIDYDSTETISSVENASWKSSSDKGSVTVRKKIAAADAVAGGASTSVTLQDLVRIYLTNEGNKDQKVEDIDHQNETGFIEELIFRFDAEWLALLTNKKGLADMLHFNGDKELTEVENEKITSITFLNAFSSDTELKFIITDETGLFKVSFIFVCETDVTIANNFDLFYNQYSNYLVENKNNSQAKAVFANHYYKLDDFTAFGNSNNVYNWEKGNLIDKDNVKTDLFDVIGGSDVVEFKAKGGEVYLHIKEVYTFTTVTITIYYKVKSDYSPMMYLDLYINPNIVVRETLPEGQDGAVIDLATWGTEDWTDHLDNYSFYLALGQHDVSGEEVNGFIESGSFEGLAPLTISGLNFSQGDYINISEEETSGQYKYNLVENTLDLDFGQQVAQEFEITRSTGDFNAIKIVEKGTEELAVKTSSDPVNIKLYLKYGNSASSIFALNEEDKTIETVVYGQETYVILQTSKSPYHNANNITFTNATGALNLLNDDIEVSASDIKNFVRYDNSVTAAITLQDADTTLKINLTVKAIASSIGDKFLYYTDGDGKFNHFKDVPFSVLMSTNYADLATNSVAQSLNAGAEYTIVHNSNGDSLLTDKEGFYFFGNPGYSVTLDVVEDEHNIIEIKRNEGSRFDDKIAITNLENDLDDVYVVLRLTLRQSNNLLTYYYRIKVQPNFNKGEVKYPFDVDGEYLDTSSRYYNSATKHYEIDLDEKFDETNSYLEESADKKGATRFTDPKIRDFTQGTDDAPVYKTITYQYKIGNIYDEDISSVNPLGGNVSQYLTSAFVEGDALTFFKTVENETEEPKHTKLNIGLVDESRRLTVEIIKTFYCEEVALVGGDLVYKLRFNQGTQYAYQITGDGVLPNQRNSDTYTATLVSGQDTSKEFTIYLAEKGGSTETEIHDYHWYITNTGADTIEKTNFKIESGTLTITVPVSIQKDFTVEIGFYTSQKRVFKFVIDFTSTLKFDPNTEFVGGKIYKFATEGDTKESIFSHEGYTITGDPTNDFYLISGSNIEFAHLTEDKNFTFTATHTSGYSFDFTITVKKSVDLDKLQNTRVVDDATRYGQVEFKVNISDVITKQGLSYSESGFTFEDGTKEQSITPEDVAEDGEIVLHPFTIIYMFNGKDSTKITYTFNYQYTVNRNVSLTRNYPKPDGEHESAREYLSSTDGKVEFPTNGEGKENFFFTGTADFATGQRIVVVDVAQEIKELWTINIVSLENLRVFLGENSIAQGSNIISNAETLPENISFELINAGISGTAEFAIEINKVPISYSITVVSGDAISIQRNMPQVEGGTEIIYAENMQNKQTNIFAEDRILKYQFSQSAYGTYYVKLANGEGSGVDTKIVAISVDSLRNEINVDLGQSYKGYKVAGVYTSQDALGDPVNLESIFALAPMLTSRIVAVYADGTTIKNEAVTLEIARIKEESTNDKQDEDEEQEEQNKEPTLNGDLQEVDKFELKDTDFNKTIKVAIKPKFYTKKIHVSATYDYLLTVDFEVVNNADEIGENGVGARYVTINAGIEEQSLLDVFTGFNIRHTSGNKTRYSSTDMQNSVGRMQLRLYGLAERPLVVEGNPEKDTIGKLTQSAVNYHTYLQTTEDAKKIIYGTGLMPITGATLNNGIATGGSGYNFITRRGATSEDSDASDYDFLLTANGAGNDGNFVMMLLSYSVTFGGITLTAQHNIMFKIMPNSSISFKENANSSAIMGSNSEIENGHSIWTNDKDHPYIVDNTDSGDSITLWNSSSNSLSAIQPHMYNKNTLNAKDFDYTYTENASAGFNDWDEMNNTFITDDGKSGANITNGWGEKDKEGKSTITSAAIISAATANASTDRKYEFTLSIPYLSFGTTKFYIDFKNVYGFKARFYFQKSSALNPVVSSVGQNNTLTEGQEYIFAPNFQTVSGASSPTYTYKLDGKDDDGNILDPTKQSLEIKITAGNEKEIKKTYNITSIAYTATLNPTQTKDVIISDSEPKDADEFNKATTKFTLGNGIVLSKTTSSNTTDQFNIDGWQTLIDTTPTSIDWTKVYYLKEEEPTLLENPAEYFKNATISATISYTVDAGENNKNITNPEQLDTIEVYSNYNDKENHQIQLTQTYTGGGAGIAGNERTAEEGEAKPDVTVVHMNGFDAYGFAKTNRTIDVNSAKQQNFTSNFNEVLIERVDFYKTDGKTWLGSSIFGNSTNGTTQTEGAKFTNLNENGDRGKLYTNKNYEFIVDESGTLETGREYESNGANKFKVPYINGIEYGEGESINVIMRVTIRGATNNTKGQTRTTDFTVQLNRADSNKTGVVTVIDNETVRTEKFPANEGNAIWLNDTLEIDLAPYETVQFAVHNRDNFKLTNNTLQVNLNDETDPAKANYVAANVITKSNTNPFWITEYVSISGSMVSGALTKNLDSDNFYVYLLDDKFTEGKEITKEENVGLFRYNVGRTTYLSTTTNVYGGIINQYDNISLRINDQRELSNNSKSVKLFFLKKMPAQTMAANGNRIYRYSNTFSVVPKFTSAGADQNSLSSDGRTLKINDYYKIENSGSYYYIIPRNAWGLNVLVNGEKGSLSLTTTNPWEYEYEVETQNGSATIDKDGNIITNTDFSVGWNEVEVTVREKVSGFDGNFEEGHGTIPLTSRSNSTRRIILTFEEDKVAEEETETTMAAGSYYVDNKTLITLKSGDIIRYPGVAEPSQKAKLSTQQSGKSFAVTQNQQLDLKAMFGDDYKTKNWTNVNFYLVGYKKGDSGENNVEVRNNINTYRGFAETGTYTITVVATGRENATATEMTAESFTATINVYNTSNSTNLIYDKQQRGATVNLNTVIGAESANNEKWYEITGGVTEELADGTVTIAEGINRRQFLLGDHVYNIIFVGYSKIETKTVATSGNYTLSNLVAGSTSNISGGKFYSYKEGDDNVGETVIEYFNGYTAPSHLLEKTYYYLYTDKESNKEVLIQYNVEYYLVQGNVETYQGTLKVDKAIKPQEEEKDSQGEGSDVQNEVKYEYSVSQSAVETLVKERLKLGTESVTLYTKDQYGILTEFTGKTFTDEEWGTGLARYNFNLAVLYNNRIRQITLSAYLYQEEKSLSVATGIATSYRIAQLAGQVRTLFGISDEKSYVTFYKINDGVVDTNPVGEIILGDSIESKKYEGKYWVRIGNDYFILDLTLNLYQQEKSLTLATSTSTYEITQLTEQVKALFKKDTEDVTFYELKEGVFDTKTPVVEIALKESKKVEGKYLVKIGEDYFILDLTLYLSNESTESFNTTSQTYDSLVNEIKEQKSVDEAKIHIFKKSQGTSFYVEQTGEFSLEENDELFFAIEDDKNVIGNLIKITVSEGE